MSKTPKKIKRTILVIEDEQPLLNAITTMLKKNGFNVLTCRDIQCGLEYIAEQPCIDLVWLDHFLLGKETGLDFVIKMKNDFPKKAIPIFIVSVSIDLKKANQYLQLGAEKYYTKSNFGLQEIIDDIIKYFNK